MSRHVMMSEIASTCSTPETGRHNHRKVAAKIPIIGAKTPEEEECVTRSLLPTRNGCRKGKTPTRSRFSYRKETTTLPLPVVAGRIEGLSRYIQENSAKGYLTVEES